MKEEKELDYTFCKECEMSTAVVSEHRTISRKEDGEGSDQDIDQYSMYCPECDNIYAVEFVDGELKGYV